MTLFAKSMSVEIRKVSAPTVEAFLSFYKLSFLNKGLSKQAYMHVHQNN